MNGCTNCDDWEGNESLAVCAECWPEKIEMLTNPKPCEWKRMFSNFDDIWEASCGMNWEFTFGGPEENEVLFCPGCGHPIKLKGES